MITNGWRLSFWSLWILYKDFFLTLQFSWLQMYLSEWNYIFLKSSFRVDHFLKTGRNAFIGRLFKLTVMDGKENKKRAPKVNAAQKKFLIYYLWAKFKARWKKNEQNYNTLLSFMYSLHVFISFLNQFWQSYNEYW